MGTLLEKLIGLKVIRINIVSGSFQVILENNATFSILYPFIFEGGNERSLIGKKFSGEIESDLELKIIFEEISIKINKDRKHGPEFMILETGNHPIIIWNQ